MKGGSANGVCPVCLLGGCGLVLGRGGAEKGVVDWTGANTLVLEFLAQLCMAALWLIQPTPTAEAVVRIPGKTLLILSFRNGIGMWGRWGVGSQAFLMVTSACSCVDRERLGLGVGWYWCVLADCGG